MIIENIIQIWNPILSRKSKPVKNLKSAKIKKIIRNLIDTMRASNLIWIAAPQIWINERIFVTELTVTKFRKAKDADILRVFINPKIIWKSKGQCSMYEWCGSIAYSKLFAPVKRPNKIVIEAFDENGEILFVHADWLLWRVIQHEYDHLDGIAFTEKITDIKKIMSSEEYIKRIVQRKK